MEYGYINLVKKEEIVYENFKISPEGKHQLPLIFKYLFNQLYYKSACINKTKYIIYIGRNRVGSGRSCRLYRDEDVWRIRRGNADSRMHSTV